MSYRLEVAAAGDISTKVENVALLWTQLPDISWSRVQRELTPWYQRMAKYGVIVASRFDFQTIEELQKKIIIDIARFTNIGDLVVDPFCGSSTVGKFAIDLERNYFGCDISQIAIDRSESRLCVYA